MSLISSQRVVQMLKNGHNHGADHIPCALIDLAIENGREMCLMLTELDPTYPDEAYGLIDTSDGDPVMSHINLKLLEAASRAMGKTISSDPYFDPSYPISVYRVAADEVGYITTSPAHLETAARKLGLEPR